MILKGDLSTVALTEVFQFIISAKKEGTLIVYDDNSRKEIYFGQDAIRLLSTGKRKGLPLGELLVNKKIITSSQLDEALAVQKTTTKKLGEIICLLGFTRQDDIDKILLRQIEDEIYDLFSWADAKFEFIDTPIPSSFLVSEKNPVSLLILDIVSLLTKLSQRRHEWEGVKDSFSSSGSIFKLTDDYEEIAPSVQLSEEERTIFPLVSSFRTLDDIVHESSLKPGDTYQIIKNLVRKKVIMEIAPHQIKDYARVLQRDKKTGQALLFYQEVLKTKPKDLITIGNIAEILEKLNRPAEAAAEYKKLGKLYSENNDVKMAIICYQKVLNILPSDEEIHMELFNLLVVKGRIPEAVATAKNLIKIYVGSKKMDKVLMLSDKIASVKSLDFEVRAYTAFAYSHLGDSNKATEEIDAAIKELPSQNVDALSNAYQRIINIDPNFTEIRNRLNNLNTIKTQQLKKRKRRLIITVSALFLLLLLTLLAVNDYLLYKRFLRFDKKTAELKSDGDIASAISRYQDFKCHFTLYTRLAVNKKIAGLQRLSQDKDKMVGNTLSNELEQLKRLYKQTPNRIEEQDNLEAVLKTLRSIEAQTSDAINNLSQRISSMGGSDEILAIQTNDYQKFLRELQDKILSVEKYCKDKMVVDTLSDELGQLKRLYKQTSEKIEEQNEIETVLKTLRSIEAQTGNAINDLPQRVSSMGGSDKILAALTNDYQKFLQEVRDKILSVEKYGKDKIILSNLSNELEQLKGLYKQTPEKIEEQDNLEAVLKTLQSIEARTSDAMNNLPQGVSSIGGSDRILAALTNDYQKLLREVRDKILYVKDTESARLLYDRAQELERAGKTNESAGVIKQLVTDYPNSSFARTITIPVRIESFPSGVEVLINDVSKGKTPLSINLLAKDTWTITLSKQSFAPYTTRIKPYETTALSVRLAKAAKWLFDTKAPLEITPLVIGDTVFVTTRDGCLKAVNTSDGSLRWAFQIDTPGIINSSPRLNNKLNLIFFGADDGCLYAVRPNEAVKSRHLQLKTGGFIHSSPFFSTDGQVILIASSDKNLYAMTDLGAKLWTYNANALISNTGVVDKQTVYITSDDGVVHSIDLKSGDKLWSLSLKGKLTPPVPDTNLLYVASSDNLRSDSGVPTQSGIYAINTATHQIQWSYKLQSEVIAPLTLAYNILLIPCRDGVLYALDTSSQKPLWEFHTNGSLAGGVAVSPENGMVYLGSEDCHLYAVTLSDGKELWKYKTNNKIKSAPAIGNGMIYIGSDDGYLHAVEK